jgi:hypothetical protein
MLTWTPSAMPRSASDLEIAISAALSAPVIASPALGVRAPIPPMLTTDPPLSFSAGQAARQSLSAAKTLTSKPRAH